MQEVLNNIRNCELVKVVVQEVLKKSEELCVIVQEVQLRVLIKC